jgi:D-lactate dehydrogenase (cytochrome)
VSCNASGALSYAYGPTREYVQGLTVALPTGAVLEMDRGDIISRKGLFRIPVAVTRGLAKSEIVVPVPRIASPPWHVCKNAAGLFSADPMDLVDLFIGSEGILGIILGIRTRLLPRRPPFIALVLYIPTRELAIRTVTLLDSFKRFFRDRDLSLRDAIEKILAELDTPHQALSLEQLSAISPACMEWFGSSVSPLVSKGMGSKLSRSYGCLYVEQEYADGEDPMEIAARWAELIDALNHAYGPETPPIEVDVALDQRQISRLKDERRSIPEKLNESIRPGMVKIGTDFAVPMPSLHKLLELHDDLLPKGKSFIFGHIGNAHLHSNMLPESSEEAEEFRSIYRKLAQEVCKLGGSVSAEHGIGKLKHEALEMMIGKDGIEEIRKTKKALDPNGILNPHNMVPMG